MNSLAKKFYEIGGESGFQEVIFLNEEPKLKWAEISEKVPELPRGWFELSRVDSEERIEFIAGYFLEKLPFHPIAHLSLDRFFQRLGDISIAIAKKDSESHVEMVYSLKDDSSFFRGSPPLTEEDVRQFKTEIEVPLPSDYLSFLKIHNGFGKLSEQGILCADEVSNKRRQVQDILLQRELNIEWNGRSIDPSALIPFYEDYGLNSFQCFFSDWYPGSEMGNVYLSGINYTVSDVANRNFWTEQLAFPSFLEWLSYYLEGMNVSD